jgi:hypothetical protein
MIIEEWDVVPHLRKKNFVCKLRNSGRWDRGVFEETKPVFGKWILTLHQISEKSAPTCADQRNFFTGLMEVEKRNDDFLENGKPRRPAEKDKKLKMFRKFFDDVEERYQKGTPHGISFYLELYKTLKENDNSN